MKGVLVGSRVSGLFLLLLLLPGFSLAAEEVPTLGDRGARLQLEEMEARGVLRDPAWAHAYWARSRSAPTPSARISDLRWALRFDEELTGARLDLAWSLLRQRDPDFVTQIVQAARTVTHSFLLQQQALLRIVTLGIAVLLAGLVIAAWVLLARSLPRIHHAVWEKLHFLPPEIRPGAALLTVTLPVVLVLTLSPSAAVFWSLLLGTCAAWTLLHRWERRFCVAALVMVLASPAGLAVWSRLAQPCYPESYLRGLWENQTRADFTQATVLRESPPAKATEDPDYYATLALTARRRGDYREASRLLERAITLAPSTWTYHNNLGNVRLLSGDTDAALVEYSRAVVLAPDEPLVYVNQSQAWMKRLEFTQADAALARATSLGYHFPALLNTDPSSTVVRDHRLQPASLWQRFSRGAETAQQVEWSRVPQLMLGLVFPMRPFWISLPLFFALLWVIQVRHLPRVQTCSSCGRLICRKCHYRVLRKSLCAECYAVRQEIAVPLKREAALAERRRRVSRPGWISGLILSVLLPGTGHLTRGEPRRAALLLAPSLTLLLILAGDYWGLSIQGAPRGQLGLVFHTLLGLALIGLVTLSVAGYLRASRQPHRRRSGPTPEPRSG